MGDATLRAHEPAAADPAGIANEGAASYAFCRLDELRAKKTITRWVDELRDELTAVCDAGRVRVVSSAYPQFGGEFDVDLAVRRLVCRWHRWSFDLDSGACLTHRLRTRLRAYAFEERDGMLVVRAS